MSPIDNNVDWTAPSTPGNERVARSLARSNKPQSPRLPASQRSTLDKLLGDSNLTAYDASGNDPYNATGRQFRR